MFFGLRQRCNKRAHAVVGGTRQYLEYYQAVFEQDNQPAMRQEKRGRDPQSVNLARSNLAIRCIASSGVGGRPNPIGALVRRNNRPRPEKSFWLTNSSPHAPPPSKRPPSPPLVGVHRGTYGENKTEKQNNKT